MVISALRCFARCVGSHTTVAAQCKCSNESASESYEILSSQGI